jgi:hypothetical protein
MTQVESYELAVQIVLQLSTCNFQLLRCMTCL